MSPDRHPTSAVVARTAKPAPAPNDTLSFSAADRATVRRGLTVTDHQLTVIIPAYNEERRLPRSLMALGRFLDESRLDYRVIVADDGSTDRTPQLAEEYGGRFSTVRLPQNAGKGRAVRTAMLAATGEVVAFTDADLPFDLDALIAGSDWIRRAQCEIVFGNRHGTQTAHLAQRQFVRKVASHTFHGVVRFLVGTDITDTQCGLKLFSRRAAVEIFSRAAVDGFAFDTEVVMLARQLGLAHRSIPVKLINEEASTVSLMRHSLPMLLDVIKMRARLGRERLEPELPPEWGRLTASRGRAAA